MKPNHDKIDGLLRERGWSDMIFARKLELDYSYVYRIRRGQRGVGKKFLNGLMRLCEDERLNFRDYIILD